ncbi:MAG TPA: hypothetical protein VMT87_17170 [Vicinamibacteria bacterium]|nr:hypothetical protein [Vicinamibacteria bacterium]
MSGPDRDDVVATFMRALANEPAADGRPLPDPQGILRRARLRERLAEEQAKADRATRPVLIAALLGPFAAALALTALPTAGGLASLATTGVLCALASSLALGMALAEE